MYEEVLLLKKSVDSEIHYEEITNLDCQNEESGISLKKIKINYEDFVNFHQI